MNHSAPLSIDPNQTPQTWRSWLLPIILSIGFAVSYTQSPLFYSNQNQYLLHGLAEGDYGHLSHDWLAQTKDPTPLFSLIVCYGYRLAGLAPIQIVYFAMLCSYFLMTWSLVKSLKFADGSVRSMLGFTALMCLTHCAVCRLLSVKLTGVDYPWFLQAGVAGQYALGAGLQPSCFAILLFASVAVYAKDRPVLAAILAASASWFHATYLLPAAFLTLGYIANAFAKRRFMPGIMIGMASLITALPSVIYVLLVFRPDDPAVFAESQRILATIRIPHHSVVSRWFDIVAALQILWIGVGLYLIRHRGLFRPLLVATILATITTFVQLLTSNATLALLFPWRLSVLLVPFTTIIICAMLARRIPSIVSIFAIVIFALAGAYIIFAGLGYRANDAETGMLEFVRTHSHDTDCYLIPAKIPAVGKGRGSMSASFTPPPRPAPGSNLIPVDLQRFRLITGTPIFVDFKSVPYAPKEVLEWEKRMNWAEKWYAVRDWDREETVRELREHGITDIVIPEGQRMPNRWGAPIYTDAHFSIYSIDSVQKR